MSAETDYISCESKNILRTVDMIEELIHKKALTKYEVIALGKLLQDIYTGLERILRTLLEKRAVKTKKTESWHKQLLLAAKKESLISEAQFEAFRNLLLFRHMEVHGYGFMLDEKRLGQLAEHIPDLCRSFLQNIEKTNAS
jgi:uncharacterized protein YutE (UPF0331/DUF86 family)